VRCMYYIIHNTAAEVKADDPRPTEESLAQMRASDPPVQYLVGTPKGRLTRLEKALLDEPLARLPARACR